MATSTLTRTFKGIGWIYDEDGGWFSFQDRGKHGDCHLSVNDDGYWSVTSGLGRLLADGTDTVERGIRKASCHVLALNP